MRRAGDRGPGDRRKLAVGASAVLVGSFTLAANADPARTTPSVGRRPEWARSQTAGAPPRPGRLLSSSRGAQPVRLAAADTSGVWGRRFDPSGAPTGAVFQINTFTSGDQGRGAIAADPDGNFLVAWRSDGQDGDGGSIVARRFDATGAPVGGEFVVNDYTTGDQYQPGVAADADGNFVVTWSDLARDGSDAGVFFRRIAVGGFDGTDVAVNTYTTGTQTWSHVGTDKNGDFVVVWQSDGQDGDFNGIFGRRFDQSGTAIGPEFAVNGHTTSSQSGPDVAVNAKGDFVVTWSGSGPGDIGGVFARRFDADGSPAGSEFLVNSYTTGGQNSSAVAAAKGGKFVVVWDSPQDGSSDGIFARRFKKSGAPAGPEFLVNSYTTNVQFRPDVAVDKKSNMSVVWDTYEQDGSDYGVATRAFDKKNVPGGPDTLVNTYTPGFQGVASVAVGPDGHYIVVWGGSG